jgi:hypothetical protein
MRIDYYSPERIDTIALSMLQHYSTIDVAAQMAWFHACDYKEGTRQRNFWSEVSTRIRELGPSQGKR